METVYSMIIDRMQANEGIGLYPIISTMARQGLVEVEVVERVWKERNDTLGNVPLFRYLRSKGLQNVTPREWTLDWLKMMHEKTLEEMQQPKKVEHMKALSFKEAMYALADGKAVYRIDGMQVVGFNKDCIYATGEHPHAEVIRAFAEGKKIEFNNGEGDTWTATSWPSFTVGHKYRVKPEYDLREGNTIIKHDGSMWTITTGAKLYAMTGLGRIDDGLVVFSQSMQNTNGISWDLLAGCVRDGEIAQVVVGAKNRK